MSNNTPVLAGFRTDLSKEPTKQLVEMHKAALRNCNQTIDDLRIDLATGQSSGLWDYLPPVAAYNWLSGRSEEREITRKELEEIKGQWCALATKIAVQINTRDAVEVQRVTKEVEKEQVQIFGPKAVLGPTPPQEPTVGATGFVGPAAAEAGAGFFEKLNPFYHLGKLYDTAAGFVGAGVQQTPLQRLIGLLRMLLLLLAGVGVVAAAVYAVRGVLSYSARQTEQVVKALPQLTQIAT